MNLGDVAKKINGTVEGDSSIEITGVSSIETAKTGHITFSKGKKFRWGQFLPLAGVLEGGR